MKKRKSPLIRKQGKQRHHGGRRSHLLLFLASISLTVLYLWGRVQIDFVIRENDRLDGELQNLQHVVDDVRVEVIAKKGYQRIVELAKERGMVFVSPSRIQELPVDLEGVEPMRAIREPAVQYAGFDPRRLLAALRNDSPSPPERD